MKNVLKTILIGTVLYGVYKLGERRGKNKEDVENNIFDIINKGVESIEDGIKNTMKKYVKNE